MGSSRRHSPSPVPAPPSSRVEGLVPGHPILITLAPWLYLGSEAEPMQLRAEAGIRDGKRGQAGHCGPLGPIQGLWLPREQGRRRGSARHREQGSSTAAAGTGKSRACGKSSREQRVGPGGGRRQDAPSTGHDHSTQDMTGLLHTPGAQHPAGSMGTAWTTPGRGTSCCQVLRQPWTEPRHTHTLPSRQPLMVPTKIQTNPEGRGKGHYREKHPNPTAAFGTQQPSGGRQEGAVGSAQPQRLQC